MEKLVRPSIAAVCCVYDDTDWLVPTVRSVYAAVDAYLFFVNQRPWAGNPTDNSSTIRALEELPDPDKKIRIIRQDWANEVDQRNFSVAYSQHLGFNYSMVVDADEVYHTDQLPRILHLVAQNPQIDCWHMRWFTYWKSPEYRIDPVEPYDPPVFIKHGTGGYVETRNFLANSHELVPPELGMCHHLSYARTDAQVHRKLAMFSHSHQIIPGWFETVWKAWDKNPMLENLHPVKPEYYKRAIRQDPALLPKAIEGFMLGGSSRC